jgi:hypothetical protein
MNLVTASHNCNLLYLEGMHIHKYRFEIYMTHYFDRAKNYTDQVSLVAHNNVQYY